MDGDYFGEVAAPDGTARAAARELNDADGGPGSAGRLGELGAWLAACQGTAPPRPLTRPKIVLFAGDHGITARGVSAAAPDTAARFAGTIRDGAGVLNALAEVAGAGVRVADLAIDFPGGGETRVRQGSGSIDVEDAITQEETVTALRAGAAIADAEADSGTDLLAAGAFGAGGSTVAAVLVAALTGTEPVAVIGRGSGIDDAAWMRKTVVVRDALRRAKPLRTDPVALLRACGGADFAALTGFLAQAAIRRTPVVLDGVQAAAAALVAEELAEGARAWWVAADTSPEPAHTIVLDHLDLTPVLGLNTAQGNGTAAAAAIPLLKMGSAFIGASFIALR